MVYNPAFAGQILTADWLNDHQPNMVVKSADQTVTNSTTLVNATDLTFSVVANATYYVFARICYSATNAASGGRDIQFAWTGPAGAVMERGNIIQQESDEGISANIAVARPVYMRNRALTTAQGVGGTGDTNFNTYVEWNYLTVGATAGSLQLQFAQNAAAASTSAIVRAKSWIIYQRMA